MPTPRRPRFFYGWLVVIASVLAGAVQSGGGVWGASVFASHMTDELGWARSAFFGAFTLRALVGGVLSPFVGPLQDTKNGPRVLMLLTGLTMGLSLIGLKWVDNILVFYVLFGALGALTMVGGAEMLIVAIVPKWFVRMRGRAVALASTGTAMGPLFFPFLVHGIISMVGWRDAWMVLGIGSMAIMTPLALMVRSRPEDIGLLPDGAAAAHPETPRRPEAERPPPARSEASFTRSEAVRTYAFWLLIVAFFLGMLGMGGFHANWIPYFEDIGFSPAVGAWAATAYGVCSISVRLVWGLLADRYPVRYLFVVQALLTAVSILLFLNITNVPTLIIAGRLPRAGAGRLLHHAPAHGRQLLRPAAPRRHQRPAAPLRHPERRRKPAPHRRHVRHLRHVPRGLPAGDAHLGRHGCGHVPRPPAPPPPPGELAKYLRSKEP